ncbi:MAG: hydrogenobyrinic acid a,c-diamide synthase (glutamine-hydrolyzing) [Thermodesulfovibrionales bacterium]|nr:hydrogenobyrinic acid a,c-diamide synthase (glutamine-hydrolyzing) [Thermodesulfovibrionales bacterium]
MALKGLIISGMRGGSGKTLLSLSIISYLHFKKGMKVIPFKKGPDYIDAGWLSVAADNPCYNLDSYLIPEERLIRSFVYHSKGDISIVEGNRGLYDGMDVDGTHSTARLSKILNLPVILIIDCTKITRTAAALVLGAMSLDREVKIAGVVLNQVSGSRHESIIRQSVERYCGVSVIGAIPRLNEELPERHMGLLPHQEHHRKDAIMQLALTIAEKYLDIEAILEIADTHCSWLQAAEDPVFSFPLSHSASGIRIGIMRDPAFQFYYEENLETLRLSGAELVEINALEDSAIPDIDCLYIGGGFPETNAIDLSENRGLMQDLKDAIEDGLPAYAECGGMMYLGKEIIYNDRRYQMAGILPMSFLMNDKPVSHGYTLLEVTGRNPFYPGGLQIRGHEFHYSRPVISGDLTFSFSMKRGDGIMDKKDGVCYKNLLATYTHVHVYGTPQWAEGLIKKAIEYRRRKDA